MKRAKIFLQNQLPDIDKLLSGLAAKFLGGRRSEKGDNQSSSRGNGSGGDEGGGDGDGSSVNLPSARYIVLIVSSIVILLWALSGFFTVDASERAVMFRFGKPNGIRMPGLSWRMPLIEDHRIVNLTEVRRVEVGFRNDAKRKDPRESLMLTGDLNIIDMQFVVQYALNDPEKFLFENRFANNRAEDVVKQVAETAMREVAGKSEIDFVLYEGRENIASETEQTMQKILDRYNTGIEIREVAIQNVQPPDQVQDAFEDAIRARKDYDRKINEGKAYANDILPRSQGQAARLLEDAEAYRRSSIAGAQGGAARFLLVADEYAKAPAVTRRRLYLETLDEVMGRAKKIIIDQPEGASNLVYLPLDKLFGGAAAAPGVFDPASAPIDQSRNTAPPSSLDELRNRLRQGVRGGIDALKGGGGTGQ